MPSVPVAVAIESVPFIVVLPAVSTLNKSVEPDWF
jgi:hypothetical protein